MGTGWRKIFSSFERQNSARKSDLAALADDLSRPIQADERSRIIASQSNPWPTRHKWHSKWAPIDPIDWRMPAVPLPQNWLDFLAWSNGGLATNNAMEFGFFGTSEIREYLLSYHIPQYMPSAIPFGLDGSGNFALFDVRGPMLGADYPILVVAAGNLGFDEARSIATTFEAFCRRTEPVEDVL